MQYGTPVYYEGKDGIAPLAFIISKTGGANADLLVFDNNGAGTVQKDVARRDEGGGHTWKPA